MSAYKRLIEVNEQRVTVLNKAGKLQLLLAIIIAMPIYTYFKYFLKHINN